MLGEQYAITQWSPIPIKYLVHTVETGNLSMNALYSYDKTDTRDPIKVFTVTAKWLDLSKQGHETQ